MSEDWDVDSYKTDYESEEHWELRRNFMLAHKDKLSEDELVCMAQVFTNIEFMGCRYPNETMVRVAELAKGVVEKFREKKKDSLKRTFVAASDAASAKVKGLKRQADEDSSRPKKKINFIPENSNQQLEIKNINETQIITLDDSDNDDNKNEQDNFQSKLFINPYATNQKKKYGGVKTYNVGGSSNAQEKKNEPTGYSITKFPGPFSNFVLFLHSDGEHPVSTLERNASVNKQSVRWDCSATNDAQKICKVFINDVLLAEEIGPNIKAAKENASVASIKKLKELCYAVKVKAKFFSDTTVGASSLSKNVPNTTECQLGQDNVGSKLMKLMGWKGGGLGKQQQGISEPVSAAIHVRREGLGHNQPNSNIKTFKKNAREYIKEWLESNSDQDLVFSSEFSNEERKAMHELAQSFSLKSKSYGKNEDRHLVISKKPTPWKIVEELLRMGGSNDKYELSTPNEQLCQIPLN